MKTEPWQQQRGSRSSKKKKNISWGRARFVARTSCRCAAREYLRAVQRAAALFKWGEVVTLGFLLNPNLLRVTSSPCQLMWHAEQAGQRAAPPLTHSLLGKLRLVRRQLLLQKCRGWRSCLQNTESFSCCWLPGSCFATFSGGKEQQFCTEFCCRGSFL